LLIARITSLHLTIPHGARDTRLPSEELPMIITVFRSRLRPGIRDEYVALANRMNELAATMPGYISHKGFFAEDGERVTVVEFESEEGMRAWRMHPEHITAQRLARQRYYAEYHLQVCELVRDSHYKSEEPEAAAQLSDSTAGV
jgi:heme-degrading monooxygenase HmoA